MKFSTLFSVLCLLSAVGVFTWVAARAVERPEQHRQPEAGAQHAGSPSSGGSPLMATPPPAPSSSSGTAQADGGLPKTPSPLIEGPEEDLSPHGVDYAAIAQRIETHWGTPSEEWQPTLAGLTALTLGAWPADMLDEEVDQFGHVSTLREIVGAFPTREDLVLAMQDDAVVETLTRTLKAEIAVGLMADRGASETDQALAQNTFDVWREALMRALERATTYKHWTLLDETYSALVEADEPPGDIPPPEVNH